MQHRRSRLQCLDDAAAGHVDDLDGVVVGKGEVDPDLSTVGTRHDEDRLAVGDLTRTADL